MPKTQRAVQSNEGLPILIVLCSLERIASIAEPDPNKKPGTKPGSRECGKFHKYSACSMRADLLITPRGGKKGSCLRHRNDCDDALPAEYTRLRYVQRSRRHPAQRECCTGMCSFQLRLLPICSSPDAGESCQPFVLPFQPSNKSARASSGGEDPNSFRKKSDVIGARDVIRCPTCNRCPSASAGIT